MKRVSLSGEADVVVAGFRLRAELIRGPLGESKSLARREGTELAEALV